MYFYIQVLLAGEKYLDWEQVIAKRLHEGLGNFVGMSSFYMSSYLFYILAYTGDWKGLHNEPWVDGMKVYDYYPLLQQKKYAKHFTRWNDVFVGRLPFELQSDINKRMSIEAMELISIYGIFFIQFPRFTYLWGGGFEGEPLKLPRYSFDSYVLIKVSRWLAHIDKKLVTKGKSEVVFPIELDYYSCKSVSDALNLELEFKKMNLQPYISRWKFDNRGYAVENLNVDDHFPWTPILGKL